MRPIPTFVVALSFLLAGSSLIGAEGATKEPGETKIRLLSEALRARDRGDFAEAKARLRELQQIAPTDGTVARLLGALEAASAKPIEVRATGADPEASEVELLAREEEERLRHLAERATAAIFEASELAQSGEHPAAVAQLVRAQSALPRNPATRGLHERIEAAIAQAAIGRRTGNDADARISEVDDLPLAGGQSAASPHKESNPKKAGEIPHVEQPVAVDARVTGLVVRGRAQYLAGEPELAGRTFARVLELDPTNEGARAFLERIASLSVDRNENRTLTTAQLLNEVERAWQRPQAEAAHAAASAPAAVDSGVGEKLDLIVLPNVNFSGIELSRAVALLSAAAHEFDQASGSPRGVNIALVDPNRSNPIVDLTLHNLPLRRVLDLVTAAVGYQYEVEADVVVIRPGGESPALETEFFAVSRAAVLRMTGWGARRLHDAANTSSGVTPSMAGGETEPGDGATLRRFLQLAGVGFDNVSGSSLAFDGSQLIVTQTRRNLGRIRNIIARYSEVRQVEIEAKFIEVQDGALEELGVNWNLGKKPTQHSGANVTDYATSNRSLSRAFASNSSSSQGAIVRPASEVVAAGSTGESATALNLPILNNAPQFPGAANLGTAANALATISGIVGEFSVNAVVRALSQRSGTQLLSAPKLTVLSGSAATITVAQELRYPQSYGQVQSQVGTGSASGGGSAGVTITAGTPQEFATRNIGVELRVTPTVEEDDHSISLELNPKVTEFEGFVEYGGQSVAVSGSTTVTVPSGFYQPIFAVREVTTRVTIWDGATLVMGGLTREDTRKTNDKVPVIGNVPVLGRLFRSSGESAQKRNLLIFVTANLVNPGGALKKAPSRGAPVGSIFRNPTIVTPEGVAGREVVR